MEVSMSACCRRILPARTARGHSGAGSASPRLSRPAGTIRVPAAPPRRDTAQAPHAGSLRWPGRAASSGRPREEGDGDAGPRQAALPQHGEQGAGGNRGQRGQPSATQGGQRTWRKAGSGHAATAAGQRRGCGGGSAPQLPGAARHGWAGSLGGGKLARRRRARTRRFFTAPEGGPGAGLASCRVGSV